MDLQKFDHEGLREHRGVGRKPQIIRENSVFSDFFVVKS